jgi:hypothetical protein
MLIDGSAAVNVMLYSIFKKLGREDTELMKTNLTLNGVGGKSLATALFIVEVQGNYSVILGRDWIHANH